MDPVSYVALATGAYKTLKAAISTGKDLQDMTGTLSQWGKAFSDFTNLEEREKNPPFWKKTFKGSDEETALEIFANKKKMEQMREEIKDHISWNYGPSAWKEVLKIEADMRRRRKQELYKKQERIDAAINFAIGFIIFVLICSIFFLFAKISRAVSSSDPLNVFFQKGGFFSRSSILEKSEKALPHWLKVPVIS